MFLITVIVSIVASLVFIQNNKGKDNTSFRLAAGICFAFSWVMIVMWFTALIETWQIALNTPTANSKLPAWGRIVQNLLHNAVFLFPVSRFTLGVLYASPILLIPGILAALKRSQAMSIIVYSTVVNILFFWIQLLVDNWTRSSFMSIPIQGGVLLMTYVFVLYAFARQQLFRPSSE